MKKAFLGIAFLLVTTAFVLLDMKLERGVYGGTAYCQSCKRQVMMPHICPGK